MLHVTIKERYIGDLVEIDEYDPSTWRATWHLVNVRHLWRWLNERRPAFVYRRGHMYHLRTAAHYVLMRDLRQLKCYRDLPYAKH